MPTFETLPPFAADLQEPAQRRRFRRVVLDDVRAGGRAVSDADPTPRGG
ncbi:MULTISPECIES: hypothetical protein [unclassified Streptomyces]|nr:MULTISPECIES: hypothetical protein [unclassified Streptomyces]